MASMYRFRRKRRGGRRQTSLRRLMAGDRCSEFLVATGVFVVAFLIGSWLENDELAISEHESELIQCMRPRIIDGDTFDCQGVRIRLTGIDASEMPGHCRQGRDCTLGAPIASREYLRYLTHGLTKCAAISVDHYGRTIGRCESEGRDLSCAMIAGGHAVARYGRLDCS